ncbi:MAG: hypothetical protein ACTHKB_05025 [Burkholderiaceae bacterium]
MGPSSEILAQLLAAAVRLSGLPGIDPADLPPIVPMERNELNQAVCSSAPVRCSGLVAAFDTLRYRIVVDSRLDFASPQDNSYVVHEIVHVLQFKQSGSKRFTSCHAVVDSEKQAYAAQNRYLIEHDLPGEEGFTLKFAHCPD